LIRGGSWIIVGRNARSVNRNRNRRDQRNNDLGCRPAKASRRPIATVRAVGATVAPCK
jgi:hypothetical protein